jgi:hypothetical protein
MRCPTKGSGFVILAVAMASRPSRRGRSLHGSNDVLVSRAAAEVSLETVPDFLFGRAGIAFEQLSGGHDHSWRAKAALQSVLVPKSFLNGMQVSVFGDSFDGYDSSAIGLDGEHRAGFDGFTVQRHGACAANGCFAANVRSGEAGDIAQVVDEQQPRFDFVRAALSIDCKGDRSLHGGHFLGNDVAEPSGFDVR